MDEEQISQYVKQYFERNRESLKAETEKLLQEYFQRKLRENHEYWLNEMQKDDARFFGDIAVHITQHIEKKISGLQSEEGNPT